MTGPACPTAHRTDKRGSLGSLAWVAEALRQSHQDEKQYHDEAITRLQVEYERLQDRLNAMYVDKLDG